MSNENKKMAVLSFLEDENQPLSLPEILIRLQTLYVFVAERTLRRWLRGWVESGVLQRTGKKRGTRYQWVGHIQATGEELKFLQQIPASKRITLVAQLRDLWTHCSSVLDGNSFNLADTHAVLELGMTLADKPPHEQQQIVGHARALQMLYALLDSPLTQGVFFQLHRALQAEQVNDIDLHTGARWRAQPSHTSSITSNGEAVLLEHAEPEHIGSLMQALIEVINGVDLDQITLSNAHVVYADIHLGIMSIFPFDQSNGQIARLISNYLLLKARVPPLLIDPDNRREYIGLLADYQTQIGQLTDQTGAWPDDNAITPFALFCKECYPSTVKMFA